MVRLQRYSVPGMPSESGANKAEKGQRKLLFGEEGIGLRNHLCWGLRIPARHQNPLCGVLQTERPCAFVAARMFT